MRDRVVALLAWPGRLVRRLRSLLRRRNVEREMADEMRFHLEMEAAELERRGLPPAAARRRARLEFGALEAHKESGRDARGTRAVESLIDDVRHAWRQLGVRKGFTAAVVATLSLGIGATTVMYALSRATATQPLPFPHPEQLIDIAQQPPGCGNCRNISSGSFAAVGRTATTLKSTALVSGWSAIVRGRDRAQVLNAARVTPDFFGTLDIRPLLGRTFAPADTAPGRGDVVVLSESQWRTRFGGDSGIVGRSMVINGTPFTVIGVIPEPLVYPPRTDVWAPLPISASMIADHHWTDYEMVARVRASTPMARLRAELATVASDEARAYPDQMTGTTFGVHAFSLWHDGHEQQIWIFSAAVGLVLFIACVNLAALLLAQLSSRRRELAVRAAMGAGPRRIARQLLLETTAVCVIGGALGVLIAWGGIAVVRALMPADIAASIPGWPRFSLDIPVLGAAVGVALATAVVIGLWPAWRFARPDLVQELHGASRTITDRATGRRVLVGAQVAFTVILLSAAGLLTRSLQRLSATPTGISPEHVLTFQLQSPPHRPGTRVDSTSIDRLADALETVPGVASAGATFALPFSGSISSNNFDIAGRPAPPPNHHPFARMQPATPDYFAALDIRIVRGRAFHSSDGPAAPKVVIVNQALARRFFPNSDPVGQSLIISGDRWRIVGVCGDVLYGGVGRPVMPEIYRPMQQWPWSHVGVVVRTAGDPAAAASRVLAAVRRFDPDIAVWALSPLAGSYRNVLAPYLIMLGLMGGFAVIATTISAIGLYAVVSYTTAQRTREFGVRLALGASPKRLVWLVAAQGLKLTALGSTVGIALAFVLTPLMRALLYGVAPSDPVTYTGVAIGAAAVGWLASYGPARRAAGIDPMTSLQSD